jgi:putative oxygen-independent coproporphyrinogen III oxidase
VEPVAPFGVYVHVPFCTKRCDYCAFATWDDRFDLAGRYVEACRTELARAADPGDLPVATSVFFGGGTPSLLEPEQVGLVLESVVRRSDAEVTLECNPETVTVDRLVGYRDVGVTRLSFGVQSMAPHVLEGLGRVHDPRQVVAAVAAAGEAGFADAYNVDLIFGGAGETMADWEATLVGVMGFDPPPVHVSAYALTVEPGTPLANDSARHPDADDQADKYLLADEVLGCAGLAWYEISNWARPDHQCQHNLLYWQQGEYRGVGCAAHSHQVDVASGSARRWWNVRTPERYIRLVEANGALEAAGEDLEAPARRIEGLQLALRTSDGVPESALAGWEHDPVLCSLVEQAAPGFVRLTPRGRLLANEVAVRLVA